MTRTPARYPKARGGWREKHEIEATVQLATPGSASIAQRLLDLLHYARDEDLCAGCITMLAGGTVAALAAGWLVSALLSPRD